MTQRSKPLVTSFVPQPPHPKLQHVIAEAWEGGGVLGMAYSPVIRAFDEMGLRITHHAGTSAGAITAMLRALKYPPQRITELLATTPWRKFASYRPIVLARLMTTGGVFPLSFARQWLEERLVEAGMPRDATIYDVGLQTGHQLYVVATRYYATGSEPVAIESTAPVVDAVLASMAVPMFFPPVKVKGFWHCDGGVVLNHPISIFGTISTRDRLLFAAPTLEPHQVVGVRVDASSEVEDWLRHANPRRPRLLAQVRSLAALTRRAANNAHISDELWARTIRIDVGTARALDFDVTEERRLALAGAGARGLRAWLEKP